MMFGGSDFNFISFDYPVILFGLTVFILLIILDITEKNKISGNLPNNQMSRGRQFSGRKQNTSLLNKKLNASVFFFRLFLAFAIIALAGPRWGLGYSQAEYRRGLDIVFAIDVSRSMDINDAQTNNVIQSRLDRGLTIARQTVTSVSGSRFAAAIGRGRGYLAIPLTYDNEAALVFLESLDISSMTGRSTNLESLVEAASGAFQSTSAAKKIIILISDGESHDGILRNALNQCVRDGIIINTVAVGSDEGREIHEQANNPDSPLVISRRDSAIMRAAAERTGGIYIDGERDDAALILSNNLLSLSQDTEPENGKKEPKQRRTLFIIFALAAYGISKFITRQPRRIKQASAITLIMLFIFTSCSEGKLLLLEANYLHSRNRYDEALVPYLKALNHADSAPYAEYGLGITLYFMDQEEAALIRYEDSQKLLETFSENEHRELRYRNNYNSGIIFFENEDYHSAAAAFREALRADPRKIDAKRNLELSLISISVESAMQNQSDSRQEQREILFDYLREEEQQLWRSREWAPEENITGPDY